MKAVIFDMDGVIIDSEYHWNNDEEKFLEKIIPGWKKNDLWQTIGLNVNDTYRLLVGKYGLKMKRNAFMNEINRIATNINRNKANLIDGFLELIKKLKAMKIATALASSSQREWMEIILDRFSLRPLFNAVVSAQDLNTAGKPAPDIYLYTAKKLGVKPKDCVVIEDSKNGVLSAKIAGMFCVGFKNGFNRHQDLSAADIKVNGFSEVLSSLNGESFGGA